MAGWTGTWPADFDTNYRTWDFYKQFAKAIWEREQAVFGNADADWPFDDAEGNENWGQIDYYDLLPPPEPSLNEVWLPPRYAEHFRPAPQHILDDPTNNPPSNPNHTDIYYVADSPTGAWAGHPNSRASWIRHWVWEGEWINKSYWEFSKLEEKLYYHSNDYPLHKYWVFHNDQWGDMGEYSGPVTWQGIIYKWDGSAWDAVPSRDTAHPNEKSIWRGPNGRVFVTYGVPQGPATPPATPHKAYDNPNYHPRDLPGWGDLQKTLHRRAGAFFLDDIPDEITAISGDIVAFWDACGIPPEHKPNEYMSLWDGNMLVDWWNGDYMPHLYPEGFRFACSNNYPGHAGQIGTLHWILNGEGKVEQGGEGDAYNLTFETPADGYRVDSLGYTYRYNAAESQWIKTYNNGSFTRKYPRRISSLDAETDQEGNDAAIGQRARFVGPPGGGDIPLNHIVSASSSPPDPPEDNYLVLDNATGDWAGHEGKYVRWNGYNWTFYGQGNLACYACGVNRGTQTGDPVLPRRGYYIRRVPPESYVHSNGHWQKIDGKIYEYDGEKWLLAEDQSAGPDIITTYGYARPGDIIGPWIFNELYGGINVLKKTCSDAGICNNPSGGDTVTWKWWQNYDSEGWELLGSGADAHVGSQTYTYSEHQGNSNEYSTTTSPYFGSLADVPDRLVAAHWYQSPWHTQPAHGGGETDYMENEPIHYTHFATGTHSGKMACPTRFFEDLGPSTNNSPLWDVIEKAIFEWDFEYQA